MYTQTLLCVDDFIEKLQSKIFYLDVSFFYKILIGYISDLECTLHKVKSGFKIKGASVHHNSHSPVKFIFVCFDRDYVSRINVR